VLDAEPVAAGGDRACQLLMPAGEGGAEIARCAQFLSDLRQRALVGTNVFGQAALRWRCR